MKINLPEPSKQFQEFTNIPNEMFDQIQKLVDPYSFSILLYMCRKTYGFHKNADRISVIQIAQDTGMGIRTVSDRLKKLKKVGFIIITKPHERNNKKATEYSLNYGKDLSV